MANTKDKFSQTRPVSHPLSVVHCLSQTQSPASSIPQIILFLYLALKCYPIHYLSAFIALIWWLVYYVTFILFSRPLSYSPFLWSSNPVLSFCLSLSSFAVHRYLLSSIWTSILCPLSSHISLVPYLSWLNLSRPLSLKAFISIIVSSFVWKPRWSIFVLCLQISFPSRLLVRDRRVVM